MNLRLMDWAPFPFDPKRLDWIATVPRLGQTLEIRP